MNETEQAAGFPFGRLISSFSVIAIIQFGVGIWFMVGQGYDRATAGIVLQYAALLIPLGGLVLFYIAPFRAAMERWFGERPNLALGYLPMTAFVAVVVALGVGVPAFTTFVILEPASPFSELWIFMGGISMALGSLIYFILKPASHQRIFALVFLGLNAIILIGMRMFVFSFFR